MKNNFLVILIGLTAFSGIVAGGCGDYPTEARYETQQVLSRAGHGAMGPFQQDPETDLIEGFFDTPQGWHAFRFHGDFTWEWMERDEVGWIIVVYERDPATGDVSNTWVGTLPEGSDAPAGINWTGDPPPSGASPSSGS